MVYGRTRQGERWYEYLRCSGGGRCSGGATISVKLVEPYRVDAAFARIGTLLAARPAPEAGEAEKLLRAAELEIEEADRLEAAGELDRIEAGRIRSAARADVERASEQLTAAQTGGDYLAIPPEQLRELLFESGGQDALGEELPAQPKDVVTARRFLKEVLGAVTVRPGRGPVEERGTLGDAGSGMGEAVVAA